jgi:hypothetical protein
MAASGESFARNSLEARRGKPKASPVGIAPVCIPGTFSIMLSSTLERLLGQFPIRYAFIQLDGFGTPGYYGPSYGANLSIGNYAAI